MQGILPINSEQPTLHVKYAGSIIILACLLGGGTEQSLWSDHLLQIYMLPASMLGFCAFLNTRLSFSVRMLTGLICIFLAIQFLPFAAIRNIEIPPEFVQHQIYWSISIARTIEAAVFTFSVLGLFLYISCMRHVEQVSLLKFAFIGILINILIAVIQLSYSDRIDISSLLPFSITSALFANENHFSALLVSTIPFFAWRLLVFERRPALYFLVQFLLVMILLAVNSRAGIGISIIFSLLCALLFYPKKSNVYLQSIFMIFGLILISITFIFLADEQLVSADLRFVFFKNTFVGIADNWIFGTGIGTFRIAYPIYEPTKDVIEVYANHAHNDFLELVFEGGIFASLLILMYLLLVLKHLTNSKLSQAAALSALSILAHSIVDYPLRTMAIATIFAVINAFIFYKDNHNDEKNKELAQDYF